MAAYEAETFGIPGIPKVVIPHPVAVLNGQEINELALEKFPTVNRFLMEQGNFIGRSHCQHKENDTLIQLSSDILVVNHYYHEKGLTDGLPIIPPEKKRVDTFMQKACLEPEKILGKIAPKNGIATNKALAINCVMAGCKPEYMPIIIAAVEALIEPSFNLRGVQTTTHPCSPLIIVNGPIAKKLKLNGKYNAFGQGNHANATIGRAIRLILQNIGGASPGELDRSTQGQPAKYSYCVAENEDQNPWGPFHVDFQFKAEDSTVTVIAGENPHNINDHMSSEPLGLMTTISDCCSSMGMNNTYLSKSNVLVCICPEHADILFKHGWTKDDIKEYIWNKSRKTIAELKLGGMFNMAEFPDFVDKNNDSETVPIVESKEDILIIVLGGPGKHSSFVPSFGITRSVTKKIQV